MANPEYNRAEAELSIQQRLRRSKLLAKIVTPLMVTAGLATGLAGKEDLVAKISNPVMVLSAGIFFVDGRRRERHCQQVVRQYRDTLNVPERQSSAVVANLTANESGDTRLETTQPYMSSGERADATFIGSAIGSVSAFVGSGLSPEAYDGLSRLNVNIEEPIACALAVCAAGSFVASNALLDISGNRYSQQLDMIEWDAINSPPARGS